MSTQTLSAHPPLTTVRPGDSFSQRLDLPHMLALALILLLCAALRFYHLAAASLWSDEIFSRYYADVFGLHFLLTGGLSKEPTPPTYYLLLRGWMALFGSSEIALRSFSAVASVLTTIVTYCLGRTLVSKSQALASAVLFALCPMSIYFAQETRVYALFALAASVALWATASLQRDARSTRSSVLYVVFATLSIYLHATGVLFVVACGAVVWLFLLTEGSAARSQLFRWTTLNAVALVLGLPYLLHTLGASHSGGLDWVPKAGIHQIVYCIAQVLSGPVTPYPWPGLVLAGAFLAALAVSLVLDRPLRATMVTLLGVPCVYLGLVLVVSLGRPILLPRILAWVVVPLCVLAGRQLMVVGRSRFGMRLALVALFGSGLFFQLSTPGSNKEPWRSITQGYDHQLQSADLVVLSPVSDPLVLKYYAPRVKNVRLWDASLKPSIMNEAADRLHMQPITETEIQQAIESKHSVWIVAHSFDLDRVNALRVRDPSTLFQVWNCGKAPCVAVAGWEPRP